MQVVSYKEYIAIFSRYHQKNFDFSKIVLIFVITVFFAFTISFAISTNKNKLQEPVRTQIKFFETANSSFIKANQSLEDLFSSLQVAGAKIEKIDNLKESTPSPGFFVALSETQNAIYKIRQSKDNLTFQKETLKKEAAPSIYSELNTQLFRYFDKSDSLLLGLEKKQTELKDLLIATGPNFFLPVLSDESLWQSQDIEKLQDYYIGQKKEAKTSLDNFQKIQVSDELKFFKDTQLTYYNLLINVSDNILSVLKKTNVTNEDKSIVLEEAYQVLTGAKRENEFIAGKLLEEKLKVGCCELYQEDINELNNQKRLIESGLKSAQHQTNNLSFDSTKSPYIFKNFDISVLKNILKF